ncbi:tetratricopeptide repeat protein [Parasulfuritortus cantonensis]|uniref:Tetratricopeptide repeat protein n=1 Tax=Parasulfuritortus cantonensis TaxID=2528202 RepID=A0A4R1BEQ2_9PROT|nr:tetratricopeptide repeat protein [Parasulfuritortus cantonensis]TCJ15554.1 tetratricopeptide repeat protein [Parasulfuritortus cantonensis]
MLTRPPSLHPLAWLLPAAALAYLNALGAGFQFDDFNVIVDNPAVHSLAAWWAGMPGIRPLLKLSYTLNWLADPGPAGFHAVNVGLHLVNVALVWRLTGHLPVPAGWREDARGRRARILATLLFALHPIQTESVTYVSGRSMTLMAAFGLAGLLAWLEAPARARPRRWRLAAVALFAAAALTKEVAVVVPLLLLPLRHGRGRYLAPVLAALALAGLYYLFGYQHVLADPPPRSLAANLLSEANAVYYLLGQLVRPWALNIDPQLPELSAWSSRSALQVGGLAGVAAAAWLARRRAPWLAMPVFWFFVLLLPMYSVVPRLDLASERHLYLAGLGPFWLLGLAGAAMAAWPWRAGVAVLAMAGIAFGHVRNLDYQDEVALWQQTTRMAPDNARAWNNLGWACYLAGRTEAARAAYRRALALDPDDAFSRGNLELLGPPPRAPGAAPTSAGTP